MLAIVLVGCREDDFGMGNGPAKVGDEIVFGGTAGYGSQTRTVYGDKWPGNPGYTEIRWYTGDKVRIYCAQALPIANGNTAVQYCDYNVVDGLSTTENPQNKTEDEHYSSLSAIGESGLMWGTETNHTFYGVYPAPRQLANENADALSQTASDKLKLEGNKLTGYLPNRQTPLASQTNFVQVKDGNYIVHPAMRYAYMVAKTTVNPTESSVVSLSFEPIVTAVEITLVNNSADVVDGEITETHDVVNIQGFRVSSDEVICGDFAVNIDSRTNTASSTEDTYKQIFIPAEIKTLAHGQSVTFTAFMMLDAAVDGLDNLTITIITESGQKSAKLSGKNNGIIVKAKKKNFLNNLNLNLGVVSSTLNAGNWVAHIPDQIDNKDVLVSNLSIPGAGGAASANLYEKNPTFAQQSLGIDEQWARGIRCFEFAVDRAGATSGDKNKGLGGEYILCAGRTTDKTLEDAVEKVVSCLEKSPREFAMVIITYENLDGWGGTTSYPRDPATFMYQLKTFWDNYSDKTALYDPANTTVANARGKLFCIARPTSAYFDDRAAIEDGTTVKNIDLTPTADALNVAIENCHEDILVVNGWGSLKDKWEARGYTNNVFNRGNAKVTVKKGSDSKPGRPFDVSTMTYKREATGISWSGITYRYYWGGDEPIPANYTAQVATVINSSANFYYGTQAGVALSLPNTAWIQEWARVAPNNTKVEAIGGVPSNPSLNDTYKCVYWAPTIGEKEQRIEETLNYAIKKSLSGVNLYINSLCGFFINANLAEESVKPFYRTDYSGGGNSGNSSKLTLRSEYAGMEGDIDTYAKHINNYFYKLLTDMQANGSLGSSIGIVLMDRVSDNDETDPAGYYIPQIIWTSNNFVNGDVNSATASYNIPMDEYEEGDRLASPAARGVANNEISITWE